MAFQPRVGEELTIGGISYTVGEHPMAPGIPYGQEGRQGTVYQLIPKIETSSGWKAIKVFRSNFRDPKMVYLSEQLGKYADMPGLLVCDRTVLTPQQNGELLSEHRDLMYGVVMPWIEGPTWMDLILEKRELGKRESLLLARSLAKVLSGMEQRGLAHCDLSGSNIILPRMVKNSIEDGFSYVELVDVEQMYAPQIDRPDVLLGASPGYGAYQTHQSGQWSHYADRFSGAILIAEMLCWSDPDVREKAWGESYFLPEEMQQNCERFGVLMESLRAHWGEEVARMTEVTWESEALNQCPTFGEWLLELMALDEQKSEQVEGELLEAEPIAAPAPAPFIPLPVEKQPFTVQLESVAQFYKQVEQGKDLEKLGRLDAALDVYRSVQKHLPINHPLAQDLVMVIHELEARIEAKRLLELEDIPQHEQTDVNKSKRSRYLITAVLAVALVFGGGGFVWSQMEAKKAEETARAQEEAKKQAELEAKLTAEQQAREQAEAEVKRKAELEAKQKAEAEAKQKAAADAKQKAELAAKEQAELAAKQQAEEEAKQKAAMDARRKLDQARAAREAAARQAALRQQELKRQEAARQEALRRQALQREQQKKQAIAWGANLIPKEQNGLWGYVKNSGNGEAEVAINYAYDFATAFSEGLAVVKKHGKFGYINTTGQIIVPMQYDWASPFKNGKATVKKDGKNLQINKNGEVIK